MLITGKFSSHVDSFENPQFYSDMLKYFGFYTRENAWANSKMEQQKST
jgi:hypothetical protein